MGWPFPTLSKALPACHGGDGGMPSLSVALQEERTESLTETPSATSSLLLVPQEIPEGSQAQYSFLPSA